MSVVRSRVHRPHFMVWSVAIAILILAGVATAEEEHFLSQARSAVRAGNLEEARAIVEDGVRRYPDEPQALLLLGWLRGELEDYTAAVAAYKAAQESLPLMGDCALLLRSDLAMECEHFSDAEAGYQEGVDQYPDSPYTGRMLLGLGRAAFRLDHLPEATRALEQFVHGERSDEDMIEALGLLGGVHLRAESWAGAQQVYHRLWKDYPASGEAEAAADTLEMLRQRLGLAPVSLSPEQMFNRAQKLGRSGKFSEAIDQLDQIVDSECGEEIVCEALHQQGLLYFQSGDNRRALDKLKRLTKHYPRSDPAPDGLYLQARIHWRRGFKHQFTATCKAVIESYPATEAAESAQYALGVFHLEQRKRSEARAAFEELAAADPSNSRRRDALWQLGRMHYRDREFEAAHASFTRLASINHSGYQQPATYWAARSLERLGQKEEARDLYVDLISSCPGYYYGIEAGGRLAQMRPEEQATGPSSSGRPVNFEMPASWGGERYLRVRMLDQVGFQDLALIEMAGLLEGSPPGARLEFARLAQRSGRFRRGADEIENYYGALVRERAPGLPRLFWEAAYPLAHWREIQEAARKYGQDPFLIAAIIREESRFDNAAVSRAGAQGLMQLMPSTARDEARRLGIPSRDLDLFDPATSIRLGTYSFSRRLDRFGGDIVLALAGYNAGDHRAKMWAKKLDGIERDEFIDLLPYRETRLYIKRILASYDQYRWIYGAETASRGE